MNVSERNCRTELMKFVEKREKVLVKPIHYATELLNTKLPGTEINGIQKFC